MDSGVGGREDCAILEFRKVGLANSQGMRFQNDD